MKFFVLVLFFATNLYVFCQPEFDINYINDYRKSFTIQPISYPTLSGDSLQIIVPFRFSLNFLSFEKSGEQQKLSCNFLVEFVFRDSSGIIRKSMNFRDTLFFPFADKELINTKNYLSLITTKLPLQNFSLEVSLFDKERFKVKSIKTEIRFRRIGNFLIFQPIFASRTNNSNNFALSLLNNALDFTKKDKVIIIPTFSIDGLGNLNFQIKSNNIKTNQMNWQKDIAFDVRTVLLSTSHFNYLLDTERVVIDFEHKAMVGSKSPLNFLLIDFPEKFAYLQNYSLNIYHSILRDTLNLDFRIHWENPPISLRSIHYAIELMYYILTDEKYNEILSAKKDQQWQLFFEEWKKFDTDTTTLFNEAMDEYYKRVDFAFLNFQTVGEEDGAKSERGKIFILFGKPSDVQRVIEKNGIVREEWIYYRLKKKFTFEMKFKKFELINITEL
ncbi:MAG: GWxTD domain-containing protein [Ignavibacteria bacterium]|nr:GWxTD domain-containing protein [Ignavibacteria bacterium]